MNKKSRYPYSTLSVYGVSHLHYQNPFMIAWWAASFPGFGHYLLNQYIRGTLLTLSELFINTFAHINEAIVFTFCGKFELAKSVIHPRWIYGYLIIYFYSIWDSYRTTVTQNKLFHLAELKNERIERLLFHPLEIQYLEQKNPSIAAFYSFFFPGLGQLYNHRFGLAFYAMFWWWFYISFSHVYTSILYLFLGELQKSITILQPHWLLFMPSVAGGAMYHSFITTNEHNRLFKLEQRQYITEKYQKSEVTIFN